MILTNASGVQFVVCCSSNAASDATWFTLNGNHHLTTIPHPPNLTNIPQPSLIVC